MTNMPTRARQRTLLIVCWMLLALVLVPLPAAAQSVSGEIAGGYSYLRVDGEGLPEGWFVSGAADLTPTLSIVGEVFSNRRNLTSADILEEAAADAGPDVPSFADLLEDTGIEASVTVRSLAGGIRYGRPLGRAGWFVQSVAGPAWVDTRLSVLDVDISISPSTWVWQTGGGIDVSVTRRLAVRLRGDYRRLGGFDISEELAGRGGGLAPGDLEVPGANGFSFSTGLVLRLGALRQP